MAMKSADIMRFRPKAAYRGPAGSSHAALAPAAAMGMP